MKKKYLLFILCLLMFFCVNIDGVKAATKECLYSGLVDNNDSSTGGGDGETVAVGLTITCSGNTCAVKQFSRMSVYGGEEGGTGRTIINAEPVTWASDISTTLQTFPKDKYYKNGNITCPSSIYVGFFASHPSTNETNVFDFVWEQPVDVHGNPLAGSVYTPLKGRLISSSSSMNEQVQAIAENGRTRSATGTTESRDKESIVNSIISWAQEHTGLPVDFSDLPNCSALLGTGEDSLGQMLKNIFFGISIVGILLLIILTAMDFIKAIASSDEDDTLIKAFKRSKNRIIAIIILLLLPVLVTVIVNLVNDNVYIVDGEIKVGDITECNITN